MGRKNAEHTIKGAEKPPELVDELKTAGSCCDLQKSNFPEAQRETSAQEARQRQKVSGVNEAGQDVSNVPQVSLEVRRTEADCLWRLQESCSLRSEDSTRPATHASPARIWPPLPLPWRRRPSRLGLGLRGRLLLLGLGLRKLPRDFPGDLLRDLLGNQISHYLRDHLRRFSGPLLGGLPHHEKEHSNYPIRTGTRPRNPLVKFFDKINEISQTPFRNPALRDRIFATLFRLAAECLSVYGTLESERQGLGRKKKIPLEDGSTIEGTIMPFQSGGEHWNEYLVEDGTVLRVKLVATEAIRVDGQYDQDGNPLYMLNSTNVMVVSAPEDLKQGGG